jgi:hypothetical protein
MGQLWAVLLRMKTGQKGNSGANRFHGIAKGETGVLWCRFRKHKGNSG